MTASTAFQSLVTSFIGTAVQSTKDNETTEYVVARLSDKVGSLKDGSKAEYVVLEKKGDTATIIALHPVAAKRLLTKGTEGTMVLVKSDVAEDVVATELVGTVQEGEPAFVETVTEDKKEVKAEDTKGPSKKERALAIYAEVVAAGGARKECVARFKTELGLSDPGASTYYQNCKKLWA